MVGYIQLLTVEHSGSARSGVTLLYTVCTHFFVHHLLVVLACGACRSVAVELARAAAGCARAKGMVVCVRRLASEVSGAVAAVLVVAALHGGGAVAKNDVMVRCPPRKTVVIRTLFQPASWCLSCTRATSPPQPILLALAVVWRSYRECRGDAWSQPIRFATVDATRRYPVCQPCPSSCHNFVR